MSLKDNLIHQFIKEGLTLDQAALKADEALSDWGREMRSKVKNPHKFTASSAKIASQKRWSNAKNENQTKNTKPAQKRS